MWSKVEVELGSLSDIGYRNVEVRDRLSGAGQDETIEYVVASVLASSSTSLNDLDTEVVCDLTTSVVVLGIQNTVAVSILREVSNQTPRALI